MTDVEKRLIVEIRELRDQLAEVRNSLTAENFDLDKLSPHKAILLLLKMLKETKQEVKKLEKEIFDLKK